MKFWYLIALVVLAGCNQHTELTEQQKSEILLKGKEITSQSFVTLSNNLQKAIQSEGKIGALKYCQLKAMPLTDSIAAHYQVQIKRTALKLRNAQNTPDEKETEILKTYQKDLEQNADLKPIITKEGEVIRFFSPIILQPNCIACHGSVSTEIGNEVYEQILNQYPNDLAINFKPGDLRGIWSLTFKAN